MIKKTEFETLEELQRVYPIGSIFSTAIEKERWYCPSEEDIKAAISMWGREYYSFERGYNSRYKKI